MGRAVAFYLIGFLTGAIVCFGAFNIAMQYQGIILVHTR